jgi:hypothetical protein
MGQGGLEFITARMCGGLIHHDKLLTMDPRTVG